MISLDHLTFGYGKRPKVFTDLTLSLGEGHIHGLLGLNGIGKSTLLRLVCGVLAPDRGRIEIDGYVPSRRQAEMLARMMLVPEEPALPDIPLRRFAAVTGAFYPAYSAADFERYCAELGVSTEESPRRMSMGQHKKGYLAFALATNVRILLLDEPTNGLDIPSKATLRRLLASYATPERTVVISTHQVREIEQLIDRVTIIDREGLVLDAPLDRIARRLRFGTPQAGEKVLYTEPSAAGAEAVAVNASDEESRPDLELLFTALSRDRKTIADLLRTKSDNHE